MWTPDELDALRRDLQEIEEIDELSRETESDGLHRLAIAGTGSRPSAGSIIIMARGNGKGLLPGEGQTFHEVTIGKLSIDEETVEDGPVLKAAQAEPFEITFETEQLPDWMHADMIRADWCVRYGPTAAETMDRIARQRAEGSTMSELEAMQEIDREVADAVRVLQRVAEIAGQTMRELAAQMEEMWDNFRDHFVEPMAQTLEELQKLMEQCEYFDDDQEDDRHDGATVVLVTWLLPVPTLRQLYGQGVDYGGPGPSRLTLTRVTDDGLRRAETGTKQERRTQDGHFFQYPAGRGSLHAAAGSDRRKGQREAPGRNHFFRCRHGDDRPVEYHRVRC